MLQASLKAFTLEKCPLLSGSWFKLQCPRMALLSGEHTGTYISSHSTVKPWKYMVQASCGSQRRICNLQTLDENVHQAEPVVRCSMECQVLRTVFYRSLFAFLIPRWVAHVMKVRSDSPINTLPMSSAGFLSSAILPRPAFHH